MSDIKSKEITIVDIKEVKPHPKNRNFHSDEQIQRLSEIIKYQGFRDPLIISNQTGLLVSGHGRLMAAKKLGLKKLPVIFQDFESPDQEYASLISENSIASWSELNLTAINGDIAELDGESFDLELLGLKDFKLDYEPDSTKADTKTLITCPSCRFEFPKV